MDDARTADFIRDWKAFTERHADLSDKMLEDIAKAIAERTRPPEEVIRSVSKRRR